MKKEIIDLVKGRLSNHDNLPFSVYSAYKEQVIRSVPIVKPLLIIVLSGFKEVGGSGDIQCLSGSFIILSSNSKIDMRNIPNQEEYFAILIDFEYDDFKNLPQKSGPSKHYVAGSLNPILEKSLMQYIDFSNIAPIEVLMERKKELLKLIYYSGHTDICHIQKELTLVEQVQSLISVDLSYDWTAEQIASALFMSTSTLRRKLKQEGENINDIKVRVRLVYGLHLVQTTEMHIGCIADRCGYFSQSRFTEQFKHLFGLTPREIRKTKVLNKSECLTY